MLWNTMVLALRQIGRNPLRSLLTVLGIVIGVASVITMVAVGNGTTAAVRKQIEGLGSNLLMVRPGQRMNPLQTPNAGAPAFKEADAQAIASQIAGVRLAVAEVRAPTTLVANGRNWSSTVVGTRNEWFDANHWSLASGRLFLSEEERQGAAVCVIGPTVQRELYDNRADIVGEELRLRGFSCQIVGVLKSKGQAALGADQDDVAVLPLATVQRRLTGNTRVHTLLVAMDPGSDADRIKASVTELMRERRKLAAGEDDNFNVLDTRQIAETLSATTRIMTGLLGAVAAVSLVVGGIGIMNIMLVSVTERTREIGVRMAIGALGREVQLQFLIEAVTLAIFGGVVGVLLATLASLGISAAMDVPYQFDLATNIRSLLFAAVVGVVFGYLPARRAARLDPIEALRHE